MESTVYIDNNKIIIPNAKIDQVVTDDSGNEIEIVVETFNGRETYKKIDGEFKLVVPKPKLKEPETN